MFYSAQLGGVVLFPGWGYLTGQVWFLDDLANSSWSELKRTNSPNQPQVAMVAHQPGSGEFLLVNGNEGGDVETWIFHSGNLTWERIPTDPTPRINWGAGLEYAGSDTFVMTLPLGGGTSIEKTWLFGAKNHTWWRVFPQVQPMNIGKMYTTAYMPPGKVAMIGERIAGEPTTRELWFFELAGLAWKKSPVYAPIGGIEFVTELGTLLLAGGDGRGAVYLYDLAMDEWRTFGNGSFFPPSYTPGIAYNPQDRSVVYFSGKCGGGCDLYVYRIDPVAQTWESMRPPPWPKSRAGHKMAFDKGIHQVVLFGGLEMGVNDNGGSPGQETWMFEPGNEVWKQVHPLESPPNRTDYSMVYDDKSGKSLVFGGLGPNQVLGDTWQFDGRLHEWKNLTGKVGPSPRSGHSMAYSKVTGRAYLFGGAANRSVLSDMWEFDSTTGNWSRLNLPIIPGPRSWHSFVEDTDTGLLVLIGGCSDWETCRPAGDYSDMDPWTFDPMSLEWRKLIVEGRPYFRLGQAVSYSQPAKRIVMQGGGFSGDYWGGLWALDVRSGIWIRGVGPMSSGSSAMVYVDDTKGLLVNGGWIRLQGTRLTGNTYVQGGTLGPGVPAVTKTFPGDFENDTSTQITIGVTFDQAMDNETTPGSVQIVPAISGLQMSLELSELTISYDGRLANSTKYVVTIGAEARSFFGEPLAGPFSFSFTTGTGGGGGPGPPPPKGNETLVASRIPTLVPAALTLTVAVGFAIALLPRTRARLRRYWSSSGKSAGTQDRAVEPAGDSEEPPTLEEEVARLKEKVAALEGELNKKGKGGR